MVPFHTRSRRGILQPHRGTVSVLELQKINFFYNLSLLFVQINTNSLFK